MKGKTRRAFDEKNNSSSSSAATDEKDDGTDSKVKSSSKQRNTATNTTEGSGNEVTAAASMLELHNSSTLTFPTADPPQESSSEDTAKSDQKEAPSNYCQRVIDFFDRSSTKTKEKAWKVQVFANEVVKCPEEVFVALLDILSSLGVAEFVNDGTEFHWIGKISNELLDGSLSAASKRVNFNPNLNVKANKSTLAPRRVAQDLIYLIKTKGSSMNLDELKNHIENTSGFEFLPTNFPKSWVNPLENIIQVLECLDLVHPDKINNEQPGLNIYKYGSKPKGDESSSEDIFVEPSTDQKKNSANASGSGSGSKNFKVTIREKQASLSPSRQTSSSLSGDRSKISSSLTGALIGESSSKAKVTMSFSEVGVSLQSSESKRIKRASLDDAFFSGPNPLPKPEYGEHPASSFLTSVISNSTVIDDDKVLFDNTKMSTFLNSDVPVVDMTAHAISLLPTPDAMYAYQMRCLSEFMLRYNAFYHHFSRQSGDNSSHPSFLHQQIHASINQSNSSRRSKGANEKESSGSSSENDGDTNKTDNGSPLPLYPLGMSATLQSLTDEQRMQSSQFSITDMDIIATESNDGLFLYQFIYVFASDAQAHF